MSKAEQSVLFVLTSQATMGAHTHATGFWFEELATPWWMLNDAGCRTEIAVLGESASADPLSLDTPYRSTSVDRFLADPVAVQALQAPLRLDALNVAEAAQRYDAIFLVGGHGSMWDFPQHTGLNALLTFAISANKLIVAVCHGVAGLLGLMDQDQRPFVSGRKLCGFSNEEEMAVGAHTLVPFLLEDRLRQLGADYESAGAFQAKVVVDGRLLTGQNPQSSDLLAQRLLQVLRPS